MSTNTGYTIKILAIITAIVGTISSIIIGIKLMLVIEFISGVFIGFMGIFVSFFASILLYGFGELVEDTASLVWYAKRIQNGASNSNSLSSKLSSPRPLPGPDNKFQTAQKYCPHCFLTIDQSDTSCKYCGQKLK